MLIQNATELTGHGSQEARRLVIDLLNHGLSAADPYEPVQQLIEVQGDVVHVGDIAFPLRKHGRILVVGAGKASLRIAEALDKRLGNRITDGLVVIKRGQQHALQNIRVLEASHPLPDESSVRAAEQLLDVVSNTSRGDLVFTAITGGSSSLLCLPPLGVSLREKSELHSALLLSGAPIQEVNAVRKHVSGIKGGRLAQAAAPATVLNLTVSDVVGDEPDCVAGPVVADSSTLADALKILEKHHLLNKLPHSIRRVLDDTRMETVKKLDSELVQTVYMMPQQAAYHGAQRRAFELGLTVKNVPTGIEGESQDVGRRFATALSMLSQDQSLHHPSVLLACGEMTVTMPGGGGVGGPNQEAALASALAISGNHHLAVAVLGTDGTDGPTPYAGGLVDGTTLKRAQSEGFNLSELITQHDSTSALKRLNDLIYTGHTGTNVADLLIGVVVN